MLVVVELSAAAAGAVLAGVVLAAELSAEAVGEGLLLPLFLKSVAYQPEPLS